MLGLWCEVRADRWRRGRLGRGPALVGGILAGPVEGVEWDFGRTMVLDGGFLVPITPPVNRAPAAADDDGGDGDASKPSGGAAGGRSGTGRGGK